MSEPRKSGPFTFPWPDDPTYGTLAVRDNGSWYYREWAGGAKPWRTKSYGKVDELRAKELHRDRFGQALISADVRETRCDVAFERFIDRKTRKGQIETAKRYSSSWRNNAADILGPKLVSEADRRLVIRVLDHAADRGKKVQVRRHEQPRTEGQLSAASVAAVQKMLQAFFTFCIREGYLVGTNPAKLDKEDKPELLEPEVVRKSSVLSELEIAKVAEFVSLPGKRRNPANKASACKREMLVWFLADTGVRISEALGVNVCDLDLGAGARVWITKQANRNRKPSDHTTWAKGLKSKKTRVGDPTRYVPLSDEAIERLWIYLECGFAEGWLSEEGLLFPSQKGTPMTHNAISVYLQNASAVIGRRVHCHMFRHHCISMWLAAGVSIDRVSKYSGDTPHVIRSVYQEWIDDPTMHELDRNAVSNWRAQRQMDNVIELRPERRAV